MKFSKNNNRHYKSCGQVKGGLYEDCASTRILEIAKVRSKRLIMTKTKYEFVLVRPGEIAPVKLDKEKLSAEDPKMAILMSWWTDNIKGNSPKHNLFTK